MQSINIWPQEPSIQGEKVKTGFIFEKTQDRRIIWYEIPIEFSSSLSKWCDPYVLAALFEAMNTPANLVIHGAVSPSLIDNLREFQIIWNAWFPKLYSPVEIIPDNELERSMPKHSNQLLAFSGGLDSCYAAWKFTRSDNIHLPYSSLTGLIINGYEFPPKYEDTFNRAVDKARIILDSVGMKLIPITTNLRTINQFQDNAGGAFLASCLMLFQEEFVSGLISSSYPYSHLVLPYGSNPLTDRMMSSQTFSIIHGGAEATRIEKIAQIAEWPEAMQYMRVCLGREPSKRDNNCCRCEKCVRNILEFRALGFGLPPSFEKDINIWQIIKLKYSYYTQLGNSYEDILTAIDTNHIHAAWVLALKFTVIKNRARINLERISWLNSLLRKIKNRLRIRRDFNA